MKPPKTPKPNGVVEMHNWTLLDMVYSTMNQASLPISFQVYTLDTSAEILNLVPTKKVSKIPHEKWTGKPPSLIHIKVWGCEVLVRRETSYKHEP